jgi:hypothetical protein
MNKCVKCGGSGVIEKDTKSYECECSLIKRIAAAMPVYIKRAEVRKEHLDLPIMGMTSKHILVISSWLDLKAVLKALMISNPQKLIRVTSDREIRDVYVGSKSRAARGDEDGKIYNSLEDLMDIADLVLVRLNELSYKNKAASGALEEAVSYRVDRDKPTWLFSDTSKPFTQGSHAYSDSVNDIIKTSFRPLRIPTILSDFNPEFDEIIPERIKKPSNIQESVSPGPALQEPEEVPQKPEKKPKLKIRPVEDEDVPGLSMYGSGISTTNSKYRRKS